MIDRVSDEAVAASIVPTLRAVHVAGGGSWAAQTVAQLIGLVEYVESRGPDPRDDRLATLTAALDALMTNPLVPVDGAPEERAAAALVAAVGRTDAHADAVRSLLRTVLVAELDEELASTMVLMDGFRGRVRDA